MKIYLVTDGEYSDYRIVGAFSTMEKAERGKVLLASYNDVEEFELDGIPGSPPGLLPFKAVMKRNGDNANAWRETIDGFKPAHRFTQWDGGMWFWTYTFARDKEHAIKIANEKRIMELAR
jgi:hypothetical protein